MGPKTNSKAVAGRERKAAQQATKDAAAAGVAAAATSAEWKKGSNARGAARAEATGAKADEAARKKREKAALLAADEEAMGSGNVIKIAKGGGAKKGKKKKNDGGLSLLEDALVGDADKQAKEKKKAARLKKEREERLAAEKERRARENRAKVDPLMANTEAMIGDGSNDGVLGGVGRAANVASMEGVQASGMDSALAALSVGGGAGGDDRHPEKRMKAAHKAFEERMMPEMRDQYPGLKRQQYLDKIFTLWKKSPENPTNQPRD